MDLILASTSVYRRALLERLQLPFSCVNPAVDETPSPGETPRDLARRLALAKARAGAEAHPRSLVIGSDQVAAIGETVLGKPGGFETAREQLKASSGRQVHFLTALALVGPQGAWEAMADTVVTFRALADDDIDHYLHREAPYDCAGSFKVEGLGIALFERIDSDDPTALEGLPLMALSRLLREAGIEVLGPVS